MDLDHAQTDTTAGHRRPRHTDTRMRGGWLVSARVAWMVVLILTVGLFISLLPYTFADAHTICASAACSNGAHLTPDQARELHQLGLSMSFYATLYLIWSIVLEFVYVATGVVIFWRRSDDRMAFISSLALVTFGGVFRGFNPEPSLSPLLIVLSLGVAFFGNCCLGLFFYLFPTGRFVPRWTGLLALGWVVYWGINILILGTILMEPGLDLVLFLSLFVSVVITQVYRYRRVSTAEQRQQTKWVVFGISLELLGLLTLFALASLVSVEIIPNLILESLLYVFLLFIPLSIGVAMLRSHLWDIDILINRTLVYGLLTACVVAFYVLVVVGLSALLQSQGNLLISLLATGLVAVLFQPLRQRLQLAVNRLMYGERDTPYKVISRLGQRLEATLAPDAVLPTMVETVTQALKLPYAAISLKQDGEDVIAASSGRASDELARLPLNYQSEHIGDLLLAPRARGEPFSSSDQALLADLARQAGIAVHTVRLTTDLQRLTKELQHSRTHLVTAREEERRRLRRDLHDGLGSVLASLNWRAGALRMVLFRDPVAADALVVEQQNTIQAAIGDIRRLVYDLRPPALDELGLIGAICERAAKQSAPPERDSVIGLRVDVMAPDHLPALPAAVEVAAYRIVQEALVNVVRHAQAHRCCICLSCENDLLQVEVIDDGVGLPESYRAGVGLLSLRERALELGGTCEIAPMPEGGTCVRAGLPLLKHDQ
jgi:signal transduction histidine kinase